MLLPHQWQRLAMISYLSLLGWVVVWHSYLSPPVHFSPFWFAFFWAFPLLLPLQGLLKKRPYTYAWVNFILMLYFLHALTLVSLATSERWLASIELLLTTIAFLSCVQYARLQGKLMGLALPKLSKVEKEEKRRFEEDEEK